MKQISMVLGCVSCFMISCSGDVNTMAIEKFGDAITLTSTTRLSSGLAEKEDKSGKVFKLKCIMVDVCQKKGCWMNLKDGEDVITVRFKDYAFFMPKDGAGRTATIQGVLVHDSYEQTNDVGQIITTESYEILASGVELEKPKNI